MADYFYEPYFLKELSKYQRFDYLSAIDKNVYLQIEHELVTHSKPILLEAFHHRWIFSIIPLLIAKLSKQVGIKKAILLRRHAELEYRLEAIKQYLLELHQVEVILVEFEGNWYRSLRNSMTENTVVIYFGDMSPVLFPEKSQSTDTNSYLMLNDIDNENYIVRTFSFANKLADKLQLHHTLLDYYESNHFVLRSPQHPKIFSCPAIDWMFWPALELFAVEMYNNKISKC